MGCRHWHRYQPLTESGKHSSLAWRIYAEIGMHRFIVFLLVGGLGFFLVGFPSACSSTKSFGSGTDGTTSGTGIGGTSDSSGTSTSGSIGTGTSGSIGTGTSGSIGGAAGTSGGAAGAGPGQECTFGEVRCEGLIPEHCSELGQWAATHAACAIACYEAECVACAANDRECRDGAVQECVAGSWSAVELCGNACEDDACVAACTEERYQCNGDSWLQQCTDGEYVDHTECEFLCRNSECIGECKPDTRRCNPDANNESQSCNEQGQWDQSQSCEESGTFCVAGECKPCSPGTKQCSESGPQLCSEAGEWVNQGACTSPNAACFEGNCVPCTPDEKHCADNAVEQCLPDGSGFEVIETCSGQNPACLESTKTCGKCSEGTSQCFNDQVQSCDDQGAWQTIETCSGMTPQCVDSECTECDPAANERRCQTESSAQGCSASGDWGTAEDCTGATPICREDLNFACGCDEGERRCRNNTVPERCQGGAWVAQASCTGALNYCLPDTGQCVDCVPGASECQSGIAHECSDEGDWQSLDSCAGPNINCGGCDFGEDCEVDTDCDSGFCVNNVCAVCEPDDRTCQGSTPQLCSTSGNWSSQSQCSGSTPECLASSGQCVQCLSGSRACGSCNLGTQSCSGNTWGTCTGAPNLQTSNQHCGTCFNACGSGQCVSGTCRAPDGSPCDADSDCISNECSTFYADSDGDDFGAASSGTRSICGVNAPSGDWVANNSDCCDSDAEANPNYDSGARDYAAQGCNFDWNCDGDETPSIAMPGSDRCLNYTTQATCPGVVFGSDTACGVETGGTACGWDGVECTNARGALLTQTCY